MATEALLGKVNAQAVTKAVEQSDQAGAQAGKSSFKDVLASVDTMTEDIGKIMGMDNTNFSPTKDMGAISGETVGFRPGEGGSLSYGPETKDKVVDLLGDVNKGQLQMDRLVNHVLYGGKKFSNQELLVIQAQVYHWAQMTELTVKVADQGVSSVKAVLNTQVQ